MGNGKYRMQAKSQGTETTLDLLDIIGTGERVSQRSISERLGVALGLTNAVLKRCIKKGFLKIGQAPARRYAYYLTPKGFVEKSRLTAEYLSTSLQFYRDARQGYGDLFRYCANRGWKRVAIYGATELTEIASMAAVDVGLDIVGIIDPERNDPTFCGLPVFRSAEEMGRFSEPSVMILADIADPQTVYEQLITFYSPDRVLAPKLLRVTRRENVENTEGRKP